MIRQTLDFAAEGFAPMTNSEQMIRRLPSRSASLLQICGCDVEVIAPLTARILGAPCQGSSPTHGPRAYSIGPTEWLLIDYAIGDVRQTVRREADRALLRITDVSDAYVSLRVEGPAAQSVLLSDIGAPSTVITAQPGQYARVRLAQAEVVMQCIARDIFELLVDRSLAAYLEGWLVAQSRNFRSAL